MDAQTKLQSQYNKDNKHSNRNKQIPTKQKKKQKTIQHIAKENQETITTTTDKKHQHRRRQNTNF